MFQKILDINENFTMIDDDVWRKLYFKNHSLTYLWAKDKVFADVITDS